MNPLNNPREYVTAWIAAGNATLNGTPTPDSPSGKSLADLKIQLRLDYDEQVHAANAAIAAANEAEKMKAASLRQTKKSYRVFRPEDLLFAFDEVISSDIAQKFEIFKKNIQFNNSCLTELESFAHAVLGKYDPVTINSLAHSLWQIKRKIFGLPVTDHTFLVFEGRQGGGKSTAVKKLLSPLIDLHRTLNWFLSDLEDKRNYSALAENYAVIFDEMSFASRTDVSVIKDLVSSDSVKVRLLYSNSNSFIKQNCTFFGCTNLTTQSLIFDPTGMRRFIPVKCADRMNWDLINSIDILSLWRSVDETNDKGYLHLSSEKIVELQKEIQAQDDISLFVEEFSLLPEKNEELTAVPTSSLYETYKTFCENNGFKKQKNIIQFGLALKAAGIDGGQKKIQGKPTRTKLISSSSPLAKTNEVKKWN